MIRSRRGARSRPAKSCRWTQILQEVQQRYPGTVVELELTPEGGRWVYELELLAPDGRLLKLRIDAKSKQLLQGDED